MKKLSFQQFSQELSIGAHRDDIPLSGQFELTPLCNLDCKMCYVHMNDPAVKERMLSGREWISIMEQAVAHGMIYAMLTGGEAMLHPDFWDIYMYLIEQGVSIGLKTNGILLNQTAIERLAEYPPFAVDVSLYGCDSESYLAVTGHDVFEVVTTNIRAALDAGLYLRVLLTPSAYMLPWLDQIMDLAASFGAYEVAVNSLLVEPNPETGRRINDFALTLEENERIFRQTLRRFPHVRKNTEDVFYGEIPPKKPHIEPQGLYCGGGRSCFAANWDGTMGPCLDFPREIICADLKRLGFAAAWQEVNRSVKNFAVPDECSTCAYNTTCHFCPTRHRRYAVHHRCDPFVCAWQERVADISAEFLEKQDS